MRELRVQSGGKPIRVFYAFDPRRSAILLIGGDKTGQDRFYDEYIPVADRLYDEHLEELRKEGLMVSSKFPSLLLIPIRHWAQSFFNRIKIVVVGFWLEVALK